MHRTSVSSECINRAPVGNEHQRGAILLIVLVLVVAVGAMATGFLAIADLYARSSVGSFSLERARFAAESGLSYYMARLVQDPNYFLDNPTPHSSSQIGDSTFELERARPGVTSDQWDLVCVGRAGDQTYRVHTVIGRHRINVPDGIVVTGTGNPSDVVLNIRKGTTVGKYDPLTRNFDINIIGDAVIRINGSLKLESSSVIYADVTASGTVWGGNGNAIQGTLNENSRPFSVESVDSIVKELTGSSRLSNDNNVLIWNWSEAASSAPDNTVDFFAKSGTYVLPTGTYRFRYFHVDDNATVIFDTQDGPSTIICLGEKGKTGLRVDDESSVLIKPGSTWNGLLTVLGPDCNVDIDEDSVFGSRVEEPHSTMSAAYSKIIGPSDANAHFEIDDDSTIYGQLHALGHELEFEESSWYGSGAMQSLTLKSSQFFLVSPDESMPAAAGHGEYQVVAQWTPSPVEIAFDALIVHVEDLGLFLRLENTLTARLVQARDYAVQGDTTNAVNMIGSFINKVNAKRRTELTNTQANALIASASAIVTMILGI